MRCSAPLLALACALGAALAAAAGEGEGPSPWALPPFDDCAPEGGLRGWPLGEDLPPLPFKPGDVFTLKQLEILEGFLPPELWQQRERFFYEGMRLEIGPCFADYGPPEFYRAATQKFRGQPQLEDDGGLAGYAAGMPFPPEEIAASDARSGLKWAWNAALRYQGAGMRGPFRVADMVGRSGRVEPFEGEIFKVQLAFRSDRPDDDYTAPGARGKHWVAGGALSTPFDAREHAWRQYRDVEHLNDPARTDDLHAYLPNLRRVRRVSSTGVEGLYMPSFSVGVVKPLAAPRGGADGAIGAASVGGDTATITTKRSGFEGIELRPPLYDWRVLGVRDILAPINAKTASYPEEKERQFGPWGLSFGSDTWDVRRALVLQGRSHLASGGDQVARLVLYLDLQTLQPLYYMSYDSHEEPIDVGQFVGRWSESRPDYPRWPEYPERPVRAIDSVGESFANLKEDGGWRRESWTLVSTPLDDRTLKRRLSVNDLTKGH